MSYLKENKNTILYSTALVTLAILGTSVVYYVIEDDKKVRRRKEKKLAHRTTIRLLNQMKEEEVLPIEVKINQVESTIEDMTCDDKAFKMKEYTLAHSNELLLRLMEKLDAIRPHHVIMVDSANEPNSFELELISSIKTKKRTVIEAIQELFKRLDLINVKAKKESLRREEEAAKQAQLEKEEAERKAREERELEEHRKENERKAREEQERIAQEEALRRQQEEKEAQRQQQEEEEVLTESKDDLVILNNQQASEVEHITIEEEEQPLVDKEEELKTEEIVLEEEPSLETDA